MMKIEPSITLELQSGERISLGIDEAIELTRGLAKVVEEVKIEQPDQKRYKIVTKRYAKQARRIPGMSEAKKNEILRHVQKRLSSEPRTLSNLLKGISYIPNHLPTIRQFVEHQEYISKRTIGKRTYYSLRSPEIAKTTRHANVSIA